MRVLILVLVTWQLGTLLVSRSIFADVNTWLFDVRAYYVLHLLSHVSLIVLGFASVNSRRKIVEHKDVLIPVIVYGLVVVVATVSATAPLTLIRLMESLLIPATILSLAVCLPWILSPSDYRVLFRIFTVILSISCLVSVGLAVTGSSHFLGRELIRWGEYRGGSLSASGLYLNPNSLGAFLAFFPAIIVYLMCTEGRRLLLDTAAFLVIAVNLALTFSRSSQGMAIVSLLPLVWFARRRVRVASALSGALVLVGLVAWSSAAELRQYFAAALSLGGRAAIWHALLPRITERPMLGFGLLNVSSAGQTPHNVYLAQLLYYGGTGFLAFMAMFAAFGRRVCSSVLQLRGRPEAWVLTALLVGAAGQGLVEYIITYPLFFSNSLFWLVLGMVANKHL